MKKLVGIFILISLIFACKQKDRNPEGYTLNGQISAYDTGYVYLQRKIDGDLVKIDSTIVSKGKFSLSGNIDFPEFIYISFGDSKHIKGFFIENSTITIRANIDSLDAAQIIGSKSQDELKMYEDETLSFDNKMKDLFEQYKAAETDKNQAMIKQLDSTNEALKREQFAFIENYVGTHRKSMIIPYVLNRDLAYALEVNELDSMVNLLDINLNPSVYMVSLKKQVELMRTIEVGKPAPDFTLKDTTGLPVTLSSFKGKYLLIDFWASWCGDCRKEIPNVVKLYADFKPKGLEILGVSFDQNRQDWTNAIKKYNLKWTNVSDLKKWKCAAGKLYGVRSIPHTVLIDKNGIIISKNLLGDDLRAKVSELLDKK